MKRGMITSILSMVAVLMMATVAFSGEITWTNLVHTSQVGLGPGPDGLTGTSDDVADASNTSGSFSATMVEWGTTDPTNCPEAVGPDEAMFRTGTMKWCMGDPSAGAFTVTSINETNTPIPQAPVVTTSRLTPNGGPNEGTPCGFDSGDTFSGSSDWQWVNPLLGVVYEGVVPITGTIYLVSDDTPGPQVCDTVMGTQSTYTESDLLAIRDLLPGQATAYAVSCFAAAGDPNVDPCWDGAWTGSSTIMWTSGDVSSTNCDGCESGGCLAATAEAVK
jgi:hypothetical protein